MTADASLRLALLGDGPGGAGVGQPQDDKSSEVDRGHSVMQPPVVLGGSAVAQFAVAAHDPGDAAFDHRPVLAVSTLEFQCFGVPACSEQHRVMVMQRHFPAIVRSLDLFIVNIAFPGIRADFPDTDLGQMSWILNGYTVVFAAFLALAGRLGDRSGHKRVFLAGLAVFTLASAGCVVAPNVWVLVGARAVQALGGAMVMPTSVTLLFVAFPVERRSWAVGASAMIGALAAALGPPLGGILVEYSWHWVFLVNIPIGVLAFAAGIRLLPASPGIAAGRPDVLGAAALIVSIGAVAFALVRAPDIGWTATEVITALIVATLGLAVVVLRSRHHPVPAVDLSVIRVPAIGFAALALVAFMAAFAGMLVINVLPNRHVGLVSSEGGGRADAGAADCRGSVIPRAPSHCPPRRRVRRRHRRTRLRSRPCVVDHALGLDA